MNYIFETDRCRLREMNTGDAENAYKLNLHHDIFRFTTDPPFESVQAAAEFLNAYSAYRETGMGRWAVELKTTGEFIGWCGLKIHPDRNNEVDVGYRLLPEFWGNGFAAETALQCCKWGFDVIKLSKIVAWVHPENVRSLRVIEKMKMIFDNDYILKDVPWKKFYLTNPVFRATDSRFSAE